jgi:hypothetical protein
MIVKWLSAAADAASIACGSCRLALFDVIWTVRAMPDYAAQIRAEDRFAIVAALQPGEHATMADAGGQRGPSVIPFRKPRRHPELAHSTQRPSGAAGWRCRSLAS